MSRIIELAGNATVTVPAGMPKAGSHTLEAMWHMATAPAKCYVYELLCAQMQAPLLAGALISNNVTDAGQAFQSDCRSVHSNSHATLARS